MAKSDKGKKVAEAEIPIRPGGPTDEDLKLAHGQQVPYKNFAGKSEHLDMRAAQFVTDRVQRFRTRMHAPMRRWALNWATANTEASWQEHEDDVHIPETKKALDNKVARIEEGITQFDPVFEVEGVRGQLSHAKARLVGNYVYRLMELADWQELVQPVARDGELCNLMVAKIQWEARSDYIVDRKIELKFGKEQPYYEDTRYIRKAVGMRGVKIHQVDPFWFVYDLDAANIQEAGFVGDESMVWLHDLEADARRGIYPQSQIDKLKTKNGLESSARPTDGTSRSEWTDQFRRSRSIAMGSEHTQDMNGEHGPKRIRLVEMWAWFDFGNGMEGATDPFGATLRGAHKVVITVANGIVLRFQLNPFDRKIIPYAVARINRNGHDMTAPATFDSVVQANAHYDRIASNIMRWGDLAVSPLVVTSDLNSDLPDTLLDVRPGTVMKNVGTFDFIKVPDIGNAVGYFHNYWRREIEETSGSLRVFESPQETATETERKVQEQQRAIRNSIRANGNFWKQVAEITHALAAQFMSGPERFKVSGKAGRLLSKMAMITPDLMLEDVEYRFVALSNLHTYGTRQQNIRQWASTWLPVMPNMPGVNLNALARYDFELSVGMDQVRRIFPDDTPAWEIMPQEEETAMILTGQAVDVNEADDDLDHIRKIKAFLDANKDIPDYILDLFAEHLSQHIASYRQKQEMQKAEDDREQRRSDLMTLGGGQPGVDRPPEEGGMPAQQKGVTPGPDQARTVSRTGRSGNGQSQSQVMASRGA